MKLYGFQKFRFQKGSDKTKIVIEEYDLSSFNFFTQASYKEAWQFFAQIVVERTGPGKRQSVAEDNSAYVAHVYRPAPPSDQDESYAFAIISDKEYPERVAYSLMNRIHEDPAVYENEKGKFLEKYSDPKNADTITKVQYELDETTAILHKTIESVLARGEKLDSLVDRSETLSSQSRMFYKTAKKTNSCCVVM